MTRKITKKFAEQRVETNGREQGGSCGWEGGIEAPVAVGNTHSVEVAQHVAAADAALQIGVLDEREEEVGCGYVPHAGVTRGLHAAVHRDAAATNALQKFF
jgi:hypothetical protein